MGLSTDRRGRLAWPEGPRPGCSPGPPAVSGRKPVTSPPRCPSEAKDEPVTLVKAACSGCWGRRARSEGRGVASATSQASATRGGERRPSQRRPAPLQVASIQKKRRSRRVTHHLPRDLPRWRVKDVCFDVIMCDDHVFFSYPRRVSAGQVVPCSLGLWLYPATAQPTRSQPKLDTASPRASE